MPHMERYVRERPDDPFSHIGYGLMLAALGRHDEAIREGELALEILPMEKDALYAPYLIGWMAVLYEIVGDYDGALDQIETLLSNPTTESVATIEASSQWNSLRDLPRYKELIEKFK